MIFLGHRHIRYYAVTDLLRVYPRKGITECQAMQTTVVNLNVQTSTSTLQLVKVRVFVFTSEVAFE